mmetsp:Transcript_14151/g.34023  ORF Transcript_14151/g.34023 Transcript_14151/m.34023 type:complete len:484 (+) Transcript_14151:61-1512(+)
MFASRNTIKRSIIRVQYELQLVAAESAESHLSTQSRAPLPPFCRPDGRTRTDADACLHDVDDREVEVGALLDGCRRRLGRHDGAHVGGGRARGLQRLAERLEVLERGAQHLLAALLALHVRHLEQVPHEAGVALAVRQLVRVQVAHGADDGLGELVRAQREPRQVVHRAVVVAQRLQQVGVPVAQVREVPAVALEVAEAAVRAAGHAHAVPQPRGAEHLVDHVGRAVQLVARLVQVGALAHVVHLRGHRDQLVARRQHQLGGGPRRRGGARAHRRQRAQERVHRRHAGVHGLGVRRQVGHAVGPRHHGAADALQVHHHPVPVGLHALGQHLEVLELRQAPHELVHVAGGAVHGAQAARRHGVPAALHAALGAAAGLQHQLLEHLAVVQLGLQHHLRHQLVQLPRLPRRALAPQHQVRRHVVRPADARREGRQPEAARGGAHALVEVHEALLGRAHALHGAAPQRHQRHQLHRHRVQVQEVLGV